MNGKDLDEFIKDYGYDNETDIDDIEVAMFVTQRRKDKEK